MTLVDVLCGDAQARRLFHYIEYHYEPFGYGPMGTVFSKGEIDMAVLLDQSRERYLAYECKRLNVVYEGGRRSLATRYVKDGLIRFVTEQYAESLPVGCMLGYVLDGDLLSAKAKVRTAIEDNRNYVGLMAGPDAEAPLGSVERVVSRHKRLGCGQEIEIRHAFLPF